jgi:hypothetical protein
VLQVQVEEPRTQPVKAKAKPKAKPKVKTARRSTSAAKGRKTRR